VHHVGKICAQAAHKGWGINQCMLMQHTETIPAAASLRCRRPCATPVPARLPLPPWPSAACHLPPVMLRFQK
jgi:hypothetical protein